MSGTNITLSEGLTWTARGVLRLNQGRWVSSFTVLGKKRMLCLIVHTWCDNHSDNHSDNNSDNHSDNQIDNHSYDHSDNHSDNHFDNHRNNHSETQWQSHWQLHWQKQGHTCILWHVLVQIDGNLWLHCSHTQTGKQTTGQADKTNRAHSKTNSIVDKQGTIIFKNITNICNNL